MDIVPILSALKRQKTAAALITIEIALCCAIVCNALFLIVERLQRSQVDSGIAIDELVFVNTTGSGDGTDAGVRAREDLAVLAELPGVKSAAITNMIPFGGSSWNSSIRLEQDDQHSVVNAGSYYGTEDFLETMGVQLVAGRDFLPEEYVDFEALIQGEQENPRVIIITEDLARTLYGTTDVLGKTFFTGGDPSTIVGIVARLIRPNFRNDPAHGGDSMILPVRLSTAYGRFVIRVQPDKAEEVLKAAREKLRELAPNRIVLSSSTLPQLRSEYFKQDQVMAWLLVAVVVSLLVVTALGIVGLASFWVQRRRRQIGIRRALGATRTQILRYFQVENFLLVSIGVVFGMAAAYAINAWMMRAYELPHLPWWYLPVGTVVLWILGQLAVLAPALRAASVSPAIATRSV